MNHHKPTKNIDDLESEIAVLTEAKTEQPTAREILDTITKEAKPVDFQLLAYPKLTEWREEMTQLDQNKKEDQARLIDLGKKIKECKINRNHYLIYSIVELQRIAERKGWVLSKREGDPYIYNGRFWEKLDGEKYKYFLGEFSVKIGVPTTMSKHHTFRDELFKEFMSLNYLDIADSLEDQVLINLQNGCYEIGDQGGRLREFRQEDFLTYQLSFDYDPKAKAPLFEKYLERVLPSPDLRKIFFETVAYTLTKNKRCKFEKMVIFKGEGANGKSVALELIQELLGRNNVSNYSLASLTDQKGYQRANIGNKLVNIASELSGSLESDFFKQLASGEPVEARKPYMEAFILHDYARFIFACNVLPQVEHTEGFFRRFLIIPFDVTIPREERDVDLVNKIIKAGELSGIFNLVLEGLERILKQRGFSQCVEVDDIGERYKRESNSTLMFLDDEGYSISDKYYTRITELYPKYMSYCEDSNNRPFSKLSFQKMLEKNGVLVKKMNIGKVAYVELEKDLEDAKF
jgi:putative DNA primase/helicase